MDEIRNGVAQPRIFLMAVETLNIDGLAVDVQPPFVVVPREGPDTEHSFVTVAGPAADRHRRHHLIQIGRGRRPAFRIADLELLVVKRRLLRPDIPRSARKGHDPSVAIDDRGGQLHGLPLGAFVAHPRAHPDPRNGVGKIFGRDVRTALVFVRPLKRNENVVRGDQPHVAVNAAVEVPAPGIHRRHPLGIDLLVRNLQHEHVSAIVVCVIGQLEAETAVTSQMLADEFAVQVGQTVFHHAVELDEELAAAHFGPQGEMLAVKALAVPPIGIVLGMGRGDEGMQFARRFVGLPRMGHRHRLPAGIVVGDLRLRRNALHGFGRRLLIGKKPFVIGVLDLALGGGGHPQGQRRDTQQYSQSSHSGSYSESYKSTSEARNAMFNRYLNMSKIRRDQAL